MDAKKTLTVVPGIIIGVASIGVNARVPALDQASHSIGYELGSRVSAVREHFNSMDRVELKEGGAVLSWYNFNNAFNNFDDGYGR